MNIKPNHISKFITHPAVLAPTVYIGIGAGKMLLDYQKAEPHEKKKTLAKDAAILAGSVIGFTLMNPITSLLAKKEVFSNKIIKDTSYVIKQTIGATLNTFAGVAGAVYANELMKKYVLNKSYFCPPPIWNEDNPETQKAKSIFKNFSTIKQHAATQTANRVVTNLSDIPSMSILSAPMIALTGFSIANTEGYHNKLKKTTKEILANTLIPTIFVSITSLFVSNKKNIIKIPSIIGALILGSHIGMVTAEKTQKAVGKKIDAMNLKYITLK